MTREEAIAILEVSKHMATSGRMYNQAIDMAIEALTLQNLSKPNNTCEVDLISRQDALKPFCTAPDGKRIPEVDCDNFPVEFNVRFIKKHLLSLPSAEAVSEEEHVKALNDLAVAWKNKLDEESYEKGYTAGQFADRPHGEWTYLSGSKGSYMTISCPICGSTFDNVAEWKYHFCPNCGARMKGGAE